MIPLLRQSLQELNRDLSRLGQGLIVQQGDMVEVLQSLAERFDIAGLYSHQETGNLWTFERDKQVARWCKSNSITWVEFQPYEVIRRLQHRDGWSAHWEQFMRHGCIPAPDRLLPLHTLGEFKDWAKGKKQLRMEYWYRELHRKQGIFIEADENGKAQPSGGKWNYDQQNRKSFGKDGPENLPDALDFEADEITQAVIRLVNDEFADHQGKLETLHWPVTPEQAQRVYSAHE